MEYREDTVGCLSDGLCSDLPGGLSYVSGSRLSPWGVGRTQDPAQEHASHGAVMSLWSLGLEQSPAVKNMS